MYLQTHDTYILHVCFRKTYTTFFAFDQHARSPSHGRNAGGMGRDHRKSGPVYLNESQMNPTEKTGKMPQDPRKVLDSHGFPFAPKCSWRGFLAICWSLAQLCLARPVTLAWAKSTAEMIRLEFSLNGELGTCISAFLSIYFSIYPSILPPIDLSTYLTIYLSICLSYLIFSLLILPCLFLPYLSFPYLIFSYLPILAV